jgi:hypothetical protein
MERRRSKQEHGGAKPLLGDAGVLRRFLGGSSAAAAARAGWWPCGADTLWAVVL